MYKLFKRKLTGEYVISVGKDDVFKSYSEAEAHRKLTQLRSERYKQGEHLSKYSY